MSRLSIREPPLQSPLGHLECHEASCVRQLMAMVIFLMLCLPRSHLLACERRHGNKTHAYSYMPISLLSRHLGISFTTLQLHIPHSRSYIAHISCASFPVNDTIIPTVHSTSQTRPDQNKHETTKPSRVFNEPSTTLSQTSTTSSESTNEKQTNNVNQYVPDSRGIIYTTSLPRRDHILILLPNTTHQQRPFTPLLA
jgi:hypothetical protein